MKTALLQLLARVSPSRIILNNCIELISREQVGLIKYGVSLTDAPLTHEEVLQHLLEEQLDAANYTRKALMTASQARVDYATLRRDVEQLLADSDRLKGNYPQSEDGESELENAYQHAIHDMRERLKEMLHRFDSGKALRDLRR